MTDVQDRTGNGLVSSAYDPASVLPTAECLLENLHGNLALSNISRRLTGIHLRKRSKPQCRLIHRLIGPDRTYRLNGRILDPVSRQVHGRSGNISPAIRTSADFMSVRPLRENLSKTNQASKTDSMYACKKPKHRAVVTVVCLSTTKRTVSIRLLE